MKEAIDYIAGIDIAQLAADPRVLVAIAAVAVVAVLMRWKYVILLIFGLCAILAVARYSELGEAVLDMKMFLFVGGTLAVGFVLIYFLFIKGD
ncbi:MAG: hypothetical protein ACM3NF_12425 [Gemmatimonadota bacterium]